MAERRTITTSMAPGDSLAQATKVAEALRADGKVVTVGEEYEDVTVKHYGMRSVDILIEDAPAAEPEAPAEVVTTDESPTYDTEVETATTVEAAEEEPAFDAATDDPDSPA